MWDTPRRPSQISASTRTPSIYLHLPCVQFFHQELPWFLIIQWTYPTWLLSFCRFINLLRKLVMEVIVNIRKKIDGIMGETLAHSEKKKHFIKLAEFFIQYIIFMSLCLKRHYNPAICSLSSRSTQPNSCSYPCGVYATIQVWRSSKISQRVDSIQEVPNSSI